MSFSKEFIWGAGTAAYQIEGAAGEDGRGPSVWDDFCRKGSTIADNDTGDMACDHYHRYREDVALMKEIGLQVYRFSVSWPRVFPAGDGALNASGLDFYDRLVDELLGAGIQPCVTLFHWDFPSALYRRGGWLNPESPEWMAGYALAVAKKLGDRVKWWITHNEPYGFIQAGHNFGWHAPGDKLSWAHTLLAAHHALLAHGKAVQILRDAAPGAKIGMASCGYNPVPLTESAADIEAARSATFRINAQNLEPYAWFCDPAILGNYPAEGVELFGAEMPRIGASDMQTICQPLDFFGLNLYQGVLCRAGKNGESEIVRHPVGIAQTAVPWPVVPSTLRWTPRFLFERYQLPVMVTENGMANLDWVGEDGQVHDPQRIDFTRRYLLELEKAGEEGVPLVGYLHWSIMDNFEWNLAYRIRFGLIHVDYGTQKRIIKDSGRWYREVIASHGATLHPA